MVRNGRHSLTYSVSPGLKSVLGQDPVIGTLCQPLRFSRLYVFSSSKYLVGMWQKHLLLDSVPTAALDENDRWRLMPPRSP